MVEVEELRRGYTLDAALEVYEGWRCRSAGYSLQTWAGEKPGLRAFIDYMQVRGVHRPDGITPELAERWWLDVVQHYAPATRATRLAQARSFLGYCLKRGMVADDPTALLRAPRPAPEPRERLSADELLELIEVAPWPRDRILLALAVNLGLRGGEISRLRVADVRLDAREIIVRVDKTHEVDVMRIGPDLDVELRRWLAHYREQTTVTLKSPLVCAQHVDGTRMKAHLRPLKQVSEPYEVVKRALARLGWEETKQEGVHTIRRSVARLYFDDVEADESFDSALLATMTLLHHDRPETTLRYVGRDRHVLARDRHMSRPFLTRLATGQTAPVLLHSVK